MESSEGGTHSDIQLSDISDDDLRRFSDGRTRYAEERPLIRGQHQADVGRHCMTAHRSTHGGLNLQNGVTLRPVQVSTLSNCNHHSLRASNNNNHNNRAGNRLRQPLFQAPHGMVPAGGAGGLEAPITIALQGGDQFVSLAIDGQEGQVYAPVHHQGLN